MFRLAETYLLRAEAYLDLGDKVQAAGSINAVRKRANATPATAAEVDIDYILDERLRELYVEATIRDYHNLWPILYAEIERNVYADISQNHGYLN